MSDRKDSIVDRLRAGSVVAGFVATTRRRAMARRHLQPAEAALAAGRLDEAEAMVGAALEAHPEDADLLIVAAKVAGRADRLHVSIERWEAALAAAPERWLCHVGLAAALRRAHQTARASAIIAKAEAVFPNEPTVIGEAARIAEARSDFKGALTFWRRLTERPPAHPIWLGAEARALLMLDRLDEADAVLDRAERGLPPKSPERDLRYLHGIRGQVLSARKDWSAAVAFWQMFQARYPDSQLAWQHLGRAVENLSFQHVDAPSAATGEALTVEQLASIDIVENAEAYALLMGFESIGSGCEFGLVQRRFGAEPLSLLRWNAAPIAAIIAALEHALQGLGAPENTELTTLPNGEYFVSDTRWGLAMHTWLFAGQVEEATLLAKMCRRVGFLKDKLLADAASAEKIFLHHADVIEAVSLERLHALLRAHGPVQLLGVQPAYGRARPGDVVQVGEDRFVGFVERFGRREDGSWDIRFDDWLAVCRAAADAMAAARARKPSVADTDVLADIPAMMPLPEADR